MIWEPSKTELAAQRDKTTQSTLLDSVAYESCLFFLGVLCTLITLRIFA